MFLDSTCTVATTNGVANGSVCGQSSTLCRCNGSGDCKVLSGKACFYPNDCLSGTCPTGGGTCP
jgi:hypothetical protein